MERTVFLIPERSYDGELAREYLNRRYPGALGMSTIKPRLLAAWPNSKVVVITRRIIEGRQWLGPKMTLKQSTKHEDEMVEVPTPIEENLVEIFESAPIDVGSSVTLSARTMFTDAEVDYKELQERLADFAQPLYSVTRYQMKPNSDEFVFTMRAV